MLHALEALSAGYFKTLRWPLGRCARFIHTTCLPTLHLFGVERSLLVQGVRHSDDEVLVTTFPRLEFQGVLSLGACSRGQGLVDQTQPSLEN